METGAADCELTVLWLVGDDVPAELEAVARRYGAINVRRSRVAGSDLLHDLGTSPVLVVTEDDATANEMLEMGADDVFVMREWAVDAFTRALERAWARARGQRRHDLRLSELLERDASLTAELLSSALGRRLLIPLTTAAKNAEALVGALPVDLEDGTDLRTKALALATVLRHASAITERMLNFVDPHDAEMRLKLSEEVGRIAEVLRPGVERVAPFGVVLPVESCTVALPRWHLVEIVTELVGNAVEAIRRRGESDGMVLLRVYSTADRAVIEVEDDCGMPENVRRRALAPFFTTEEATHTGLGLTLAWTRARLAGGDLTIDSAPGEGTIVRVLLPFAP